MGKYKKKDILRIIDNLTELNRAVAQPENVSLPEALRLLTDGQEAAIALGTYLETWGGKYSHFVKLLEDYCENIYQMSLCISKGAERDVLAAAIREQLGALRDGICREYPPDRKEVVFLPYKASMWDSMESVWRAADEDPGCDAYVVPIPYYDKAPDGSLKEEHYEGELYPDYVPVTSYEAYDLEERKPDVIFIHNPYDGVNKVTCIHPVFFSKNLKKYTDKLVYIPYYVVPGRIPEDFILTPGVCNADLVFVQNERVRKCYMDILEQMVFPGKRSMLEKKIIAAGSPKTDKVLFCQRHNAEIPVEWKSQIKGRKVVFFNTNVNLILNNRNYFTQNLYRIFHIFERYRDDFVLLWREHPLTIETLQSMAPELLKDYVKVKEDFIRNQWGILDSTDDPHLGMAVSQCYYGAGGSLVTIYSVTGRPLMVTDYHYPNGISEKRISREEFYRSIMNRTYYKEEHVNSLELFLENYEEICSFKEQRIERISRCLDNLDGSVGEKIYAYVMDGGDTR